LYPLSSTIYFIIFYGIFMSTNDPITATNGANEETIAYTSPMATVTSTVPSWARWWRQVAFIPSLHNRWLNTYCPTTAKSSNYRS
ncbi:hypothetical protein QUV77_22425, partial [Xanthomonas citri pv. citri]